MGPKLKSMTVLWELQTAGKQRSAIISAWVDMSNNNVTVWRQVNIIEGSEMVLNEYNCCYIKFFQLFKFFLSRIQQILILLTTTVSKLRS